MKPIQIFLTLGSCSGLHQNNNRLEVLLQWDTRTRRSVWPICWLRILVDLHHLDKPFSFLDNIDDGSKNFKPETSKPPNFFGASVSPVKAKSEKAMDEEHSIPQIKWHEISKQMNPYKLPAFWEDLDPMGKSSKPISNLGLLTTQRDQEFKRLMAQNDQNCWKGALQVVSHTVYRKALDMMLMGIEGKIFVINRSTGTFSYQNFNCTIEDLSGTLL